MNTTLCWKCNQEYPITDAECPNCDAPNGNVDPDAAWKALQEFEQEQARHRMSIGGMER
jgi:Zn finger protein HypA/HybF involved in hydrogenase expression